MSDTTALEQLGRERYVSLATFRRSGVAVETPVWIAPHAGRLYLFTEAKSGKVKRLRNDARIRVAPCTARGRVTGDRIEGTGRLVTDPELERAAYDALTAKYGWQMRVANVLSRLAGRIEGRAVVELAV